MEFKQKDPDPSGIKDRMLVRLQNQQSRLIARSYWGRSTLYKQLIHISIIVITTIVLATGLNARTSSANTEIAYQNPSAYQNVDTLRQGSFVETQLTVTGNLNFKVSNYIVQDGDSVQSIADKFGVTKETVKWANPSIDYFSESIDVGKKLVIPEINGVLYEVKDGDTVDSILSKTGGDRFEVIEINQLQSPDFKLAQGSLILIPNGKLEIKRPEPVQSPTYFYYSGPPVDVSVLTGMTFINPMSACGGYTISRGFLPWHNGADLAGAYGCPIVAAAAGTIDYVGWSVYGEGNMVRIYHGNGVYTGYYHGSEFASISVGQSVNAGDVIMYEGNTGNSTGPHLHFGLRLGGYNFIDPSPYVPF